MVEKEYIPVATSDDPTFNLEGAALDGGDHLLVVQATNEDGEVSAYSDETVYSQEYDILAIEKTTMTAIADSVRAKTGKTDLIPTEEIPAEIRSILTPAGKTTIKKNGTDIPVAEFAYVDVDVPPPEGYITPTGKKTITSNASDIDVRQYEKVDVNVPVPDEYLEAANGLSEIDTLVTGRPSTVPMQGSWRLNPTVDITTAIDCNVSFITTYQDNGVEYLMTGSRIAIGVEGKYITFRGALTPEFPGVIDNWIVVYASGVWGLGSDRTITFTGEIPSELREWLNDNAESFSPSDSVKFSIQELIDMSNSTTGNSETDLVGAVGGLVDGYSDTQFDGAIETTASAHEDRTFIDSPDVSVGIDMPVFFWSGGIYYGGIVVNDATGAMLYKEWDASTDTMIQPVSVFSNGTWVNESFKNISLSGLTGYVDAPNQGEYIARGWLAANTTYSRVNTVEYNGTVTNMNPRSTIRIFCKNTVMLDDIIITTD